jgi:hypothetical protein
LITISFKPKYDTQSNKVLNHSQINMHKMMGMFCLFDFKF